jgi:hypothetical protein
MAGKENIRTPEDVDEEIKLKTNEHAKNAILQIFKAIGVNRIIYVDDRCSIQELKEAFIAKLKEKYNVKPKELDFVDWSEPKPIFEKRIVALWEDSSDEIKRELFLKVLNYEGNSNEIENSIAPLNLKNHLSDKIELLSPSEWEAKKEQIISSLGPETKILFLFDIEFEFAPLRSGRNGIDLTEELLNNQDVKDYIYCGIFSHLFNVEEEYSKRNEFHISHRFEKSRFYTISKKRFKDDLYLPGLAEGIKNTLIINEVENLKSESSKILRKSFKDSLLEIDGFTPESFNHIIQKTSRKEGIWEMATLFRINNIITKDKALNTLFSRDKRAKINESLVQIRKVEKIITGGDTPFDKTQIQSLRYKELFIDSSTLNILHFPISNGDIFQINKKEYILLGQPCNLAMRSDGKRGREYDTGFLVELESIPKETIHEYSKEQLAALGLLETAEISSKIYRIARFSKFLPVSLIPLDLTVFNSDGKAMIEMNKSEYESKIIQESWKLRYKKLYKEFLDYRNSIVTFKKLKSSNKDSFKKNIYNGFMFKNYDINNENALNRSGNRITLDIQRISYYREPYSNDLLQQFMLYLSRNAFDRDFLND